MSAPIRWGKVDSKLYQNDKFRKLSASATGLWLLCLTWSADNETDGFIPRDVAASVCRDHGEAGRLSRFAAYLVEAGLWDEAEGGFMIHDFSDYWLTKIQKTEIRAADADRQRRHRATGQPALNQHSTSTQPGVDQH